MGHVQAPKAGTLEIEIASPSRVPVNVQGASLGVHREG